MSWRARQSEDRRRRRAASLPRLIEVLEERALLADGIAPVAGAPLTATAGVPLTNAVFATFTVNDPSALLGPANLERARIDFGDGSPLDRNIPATPSGNGFQFVDTHTYAAPGTYTVTVMIAFPTSRKPGDNTVTTSVTVTAPPTPPPSIGSFAAIGKTFRAKDTRTFHGKVALFSDPNTTPGQFSAVIDWGDSTGSTAGQIRRKGRSRYVVMGSHHYASAGSFQVLVTITNSSGQEIAAQSTAIVSGR
jgi:hypothetical protein